MNTAPVISTFNQSVYENQMISMLIYSLDSENDPLTFSVDHLPQGLSINPTTGAITGTVHPNNALPSQFAESFSTISVTDGQFSASSTFQWTIFDTTPIPTLSTPPTFSGSANQTAPITGLSIVAGLPRHMSAPGAYPANVMGTMNLDDEVQLLLSVGVGSLSVSGSTGATITGNNTGTLILNGTISQINTKLGTLAYFNIVNTQTTLTTTLTGAEGAPGPQTIIISKIIEDGIGIDPENRAPSALGGNFTLIHDHTLNGAVGGSDPDGDAITFHLVSDVSHGTLTFNSDGTLTYIPDLHFVGTDSFQYKTNDGELDSNTATVYLNVTNAAPIANSDMYFAPFNTPIALSITSNDSDPDGDSFTVTLLTQPTHGTLIANGSGSYTYTPTLGYTGQDSFTYKINDGITDSGTATVSIGVGTDPNRAPYAYGSGFSVVHDREYQGTLGGGDPDGDSISFVIDTPPQHGNLVLGLYGAFTYTPDLHYVGPDSFTFHTSDGELDSDSVNVSINVTNTAPVANDDSANTDWDTPITIDVMANDSDADDDEIHAILVSQPAHGFVVANNGSFDYTPEVGFEGTVTFTYKVNDDIEDSDEATVTINISPGNRAPSAEGTALEVHRGVPESGQVTGSDPDGDSITAFVYEAPQHGSLVFSPSGAFTYTANSNWVGLDYFKFKFTDGELDSEPAIVLLESTNQAPIAVGETYGVHFNETLTINTSLLANDSDPDGDALTLIPGTLPTHGILNITANGFTYTPNTGYEGLDSFTYEVSDGVSSSSATLNLWIHDDNHAPYAGSGSFSVIHDRTLTSLAGSLLDISSDPDGDPISASLITPPTHGTLSFSSNGSFTYTPNTHYIGEDSFQYKVNDGKLDSATATITINITNENPVAVADTITTNFNTPITFNPTTNDTDADNDALSLVSAGTASHGTVSLNSNGTITYTPDLDYEGEDSFNYTITDGIATSTTTVTITVKPANRPPVAVDDEFDVVHDSELQDDVLINDTDPDGDTLTASLVSNVTHGTLDFNSDGTFIYIPNENYVGEDTFTYEISDGQYTDTAVVTIHVTNTAPIVHDDEFSISPIVPPTIDAEGVLFNDYDADGDDITAILVTQPTHGSVVLNADGSFTYTPSMTFAGTDTFTYKANDGITDSDIAIVTVTTAAIAEDDFYSVDDNTVLNVEPNGVLQNDHIAGGTPSSAELVSGPSHGTLVFDPDGGLEYTPNTGFVGEDSFVYRITGTTGSQGTATVTIDVHNEVPLAEDASFEVPVGTLTSGDLAPFVSDDDTELFFEMLSGPQHGALTLSADGSFAYLPEQGFRGQDAFVFRVGDGSAWSTSSTGSFVVVGEAPTARDREFAVEQGTSLEPSSLRNLLAAFGSTQAEPGLSIEFGDWPAQATSFIPNADGTFEYTPDEEYTGNDEFTYRVKRQGLWSDYAVVTLRVYQRMLLTPDVYFLPASGPLVVSQADLFHNDILPEDLDFGSFVIEQPAIGSVEMDEEGNIIYVAGGGQPVDTSFRYGFALAPAVAGGVAQINWAKVALFASKPEFELASEEYSGIGVYRLLDDSGNLIQPFGGPRVALSPGREFTLSVKFNVYWNDQEGLLPKLVERMRISGTYPEVQFGLAVNQPTLEYKREPGNYGVLTVTWKGLRAAGTAQALSVDHAWQIHLPGTPQAIAATQPLPKIKSKVYILAGKPQEDDSTKRPLYETVVRIGCEAANGLNAAANRNAVVEKILEAFGEGKEVKNSAGDVLTYYKIWKAALDNETYQELLAKGDGQCQSWARFCRRVLMAQGIPMPRNTLKLITPITSATRTQATLLYVATWKGADKAKNTYSKAITQNFIAALIDFPNKEYRLDVKRAVEKGTGIAGKGNSDPLAVFTNHVVLEVNLGSSTILFDPSYGKRYTGKSDDARAYSFQKEALSFLGTHVAGAAVAGIQQITVTFRDPTKVERMLQVTTLPK
jgi:VCBS repeat-containing protein